MKQEREEGRLPPWFRRPIPEGGNVRKVKGLLTDLGLRTVCQSALCPNLGECFAANTATFLIMGPSCTRGCRFCAVETAPPAPLDLDEPRRVAEAARRMGLSYVVVTSVTRDDLRDGGSGHFAETVRLLGEIPGVRAEVLVPDFRGRRESIAEVLESGPAVFNHNIETVPGLYYRIRPGADYRISLDVIKYAKWVNPGTVTKSGMMLGLGEEAAEVRGVLADLLDARCDIVTIGQYLRPSARHAKVERYAPPEEFDMWRAEALAMGFKAAASAPLVRSSHGARELWAEAVRPKGGPGCSGEKT